MPNIGLPVTQPHLPPGSQSPSHHLALLPGASPGDGCVVTDEVEGQDRNEGQSGVPEDKTAGFTTSARKRVGSRLLDTQIPVRDYLCQFLRELYCGNSYTGHVP